MVIKNSINWNWLKKFMKVDIDVTCMYINFGGHGPSSFGDTGTLKNGQISLSDHGLYCDRLYMRGVSNLGMRGV